MKTEKERRAESRYPVLDIYQKYVSCKLHNGSGHTDVIILDFSLNGIRIESPVPKEPDSEMECIISLPKLYSKDLKAKLRVRHVSPSRKNSSRYIIGAQIIESDRNYLARVYTKILEFVTLRTGELY